MSDMQLPQNNFQNVSSEGFNLQGPDSGYGENDLDYIPLHIHSDYSIIDGLQGVKAIVKKAASLKMPAIALTDWTNICGYIIFYNEARANGIKPIMGADLNIVDNAAPGEPLNYFHVTVLAMNRKGKQNLYDLLSLAWKRAEPGNMFSPNNTLEELAKYNEGLFLLNGFRGDIGYYVNEHQERKIEARLNFYLKHFEDRFCFEITRTNRDGEKSFENVALELCQEYGICPVATNDTRFLNGNNADYSDGITDYKVHDVRVSIQNKVMRGNDELARRYSDQQYLRSQKEMKEIFADLPEALYNTRAIAERCNVELELDVPRLPRYPTGDLSPAEFLRKKSEEGLIERLNFLFKDEKEREAKRQSYFDRLNVELDVIIEMGFPGYFLIVMDFIQWSKDHNVPVGPGRGSGGGSLVAYALKITDFDPMAFDLLFERFLNPERVSMPDFDIDFCQRNREKTLNYVKENYGENAVSQIAAFGTMAPKAAIKDVGRALGMSYGAVDYVAKQLPAVPGLSFKAVLGIDKKGNPCESAAPDFLALYNKAKADDDKERIELIHYAFRLEGVIKIIGKHAAGVVISPTRTAEFTPLMMDSDGNPITQFDKKDVEHAGLVKFDFLGLTTLTIIQDAVDMINEKKIRNGEPLVDIHDIPYHDDASFDVLKEGETTAVFQLESDGMRKLICQMRPDCFDDMIALVALYRPGPIKSGMVDHFVKRKHGEEEIAYPSPDFQDLDLKPILDSTYGVIVYQEQVMQIAQVLAGYSLGGADILRRAMGKKNPAEMASQRSVFRDGADKKGKDTDIAMKIFDQVEMFAEYGFNKSHSAAYALVAWWTLYLKVHYPAEFLAAMMTADRQKTEKLVSYISECKRLNIKVNSPNVNEGKFNFMVNENGEIIYGLGAIKGIGEELANHIVMIREGLDENGNKISNESDSKFKDFFDFAARVGHEHLNKKTLEALIYSGALDVLPGTRAQKFHSITKAVEYATQYEEQKDSGQGSLFDFFEDDNILATPELPDCISWPQKYILQQEKLMLGLYLSGHPIDGYIDDISQFISCSLANISPGSFDSPTFEKVAGVAISIEQKASKRDGAKFFIVTLDDSTTQMEFPFYGEQAAKLDRILNERAETHKNRVQKAPKGTDESLLSEAPLILILEISSIAGDDGVRNRVRNVNTLELLRRKNAKQITITMEEAVFNQHAQYIQSLIMQNALKVEQICSQLRAANIPSRFNLIDPPTQSDAGNKRFYGKGFKDPREDIFIDEGCTLNLMIDGINLTLDDRRNRFKPSDELIEGMRDLIGSNCVYIDY